MNVGVYPAPPRDGDAPLVGEGLLLEPQDLEFAHHAFLPGLCLMRIALVGNLSNRLMVSIIRNTNIIEVSGDITCMTFIDTEKLVVSIDATRS